MQKSALFWTFYHARGKWMGLCKNEVFCTIGIKNPFQCILFVQQGSGGGCGRKKRDGGRGGRKGNTLVFPPDVVYDGNDTLLYSIKKGSVKLK